MTGIDDLMKMPRSTVSNALALLSEKVELNCGDVKLKVRSLFGDCGLEVSVVSLVFIPHEGDALSVGLPSAKFFCGINCTTGQVEKRNVIELDEAAIDMDRNVVIASGKVFRAIEIYRSADLCDPSELAEKLVLFALSLIPTAHEFYGSPFSSLPTSITDAMPSQMRLNWAKLNSAARRGEIHFPLIKVLCNEFFQSTGVAVSAEKFRTALLSSGLYQSKRRLPTRVH